MNWRGIDFSKGHRTYSIICGGSVLENDIMMKDLIRQGFSADISPLFYEKKKFLRKEKDVIGIMMDLLTKGGNPSRIQDPLNRALDILEQYHLDNLKFRFSRQLSEGQCMKITLLTCRLLGDKKYVLNESILGYDFVEQFCRDILQPKKGTEPFEFENLVWITDSPLEEVIIEKNPYSVHKSKKNFHLFKNISHIYQWKEEKLSEYDIAALEGEIEEKKNRIQKEKEERDQLIHKRFLEIMSLVEKKNYKAALPQLEELAQNEGNADAMCQLALMYHQGLGVEPDNKMEWEWLALAEKQKSGQAYYLKGKFTMEMVDSVSKDEKKIEYIEEAERYFRRAVSYGYCKGYYAIAMIYARYTITRTKKESNYYHNPENAWFYTDEAEYGKEYGSLYVDDLIACAEKGQKEAERYLWKLQSYYPDKVKSYFGKKFEKD